MADAQIADSALGTVVDTGRGRPRSEEKNQLMLKAAAELFLDYGFDGTSMDAVARRAGVSKQTVYSHFTSKEQLFVAAVRARVADIYPDRILERLHGHSVEEALAALAKHLGEALFSAEGIGIHRVMVGAAGKDNRLVQLFWEAGPKDIHLQLTAALARWTDAGLLTCADADAAAMQFVSLVKGGLHYRLTIGLIDRPEPQHMQAHIDRAVASFLKIYRV